LKHLLSKLKFNPDLGLDLNKLNYTIVNNDFLYTEDSDLIFYPQKCNEIQGFQVFLDNLHSKINKEIFLVLTFETYRGRIRRYKTKHSRFFSFIRFLFDFLFLRVLLRIFPFKYLVYYLSKKKLIILSKAEGLGRMAFAGFEIIDTTSSKNQIFVLLKKSIKKNTTKPSYGPLFKMERLGKNGKKIKVYKFRTMHPYAEFIQQYMLKFNGYSKTGKLKNDFRITSWGKFLRKYWLDELPQLINVIKGEMKLVGIRPVSEIYYNDLPIEVQKMRIKHKPGCIPPYIAFNYITKKEMIVKAEIDYMKIRADKTFLYDFGLFFKSLYHIFFKKQRGS